MPSFDIVSETDAVELRHAVENANRELSTRYDFRGVESSIELKDLTVTLKTQSDFQVRQLEELFRNACAKRGVDCSGVDMEDEPVHSGKTFAFNLTFKQGIDQPTAKQIVKTIKESKIKVQASIQGDKIRVNGKKRDDLQQAIAMLKESAIELPMQYENFRE